MKCAPGITLLKGEPMPYKSYVNYRYRALPNTLHSLNISIPRCKPARQKVPLNYYLRATHVLTHTAT